MIRNTYQSCTILYFEPISNTKSLSPGISGLNDTYTDAHCINSQGKTFACLCAVYTDCTRYSTTHSICHLQASGDSFFHSLLSAISGCETYVKDSHLRSYRLKFMTL